MTDVCDVPGARGQGVHSGIGHTQSLSLPFCNQDYNHQRQSLWWLLRAKVVGMGGLRVLEGGVQEVDQFPWTKGLGSLSNLDSSCTAPIGSSSGTHGQAHSRTRASGGHAYQVVSRPSPHLPLTHRIN